MKIQINQLLPEVQTFAEGLELSDISEKRQKTLQKVIDYIQKKVEQGENVNLNFICTHNSRRSQLCQVWAATAVYHYGIAHVRTYSGGTEATAFHPNAVRALESAGFQIIKKEKASNPVYFTGFAVQADPLSCFSKVYNDPYNAVPFAAIMTCSDAETNCPFIPEAEARFSVKYEDPKKADGTPEEARTYAERSRQIAIEMFYVFSKIKR